jgi:hypothetical protein
VLDLQFDVPLPARSCPRMDAGNPTILPECRYASRAALRGASVWQTWALARASSDP